MPVPDLPELLLAVPAYALGTFPTAQLVARRAGHDPTAEGSGNPGASNVYRLAGRRAGAAVFAGDLAKGLVATAAGLAVGGRDLAVVTGAAAVLGHIFPVTRGLRGGKGVATAAGLAIVLYPAVSAVLAAVWVAVAKGAGKASLASLAAAAGLPVGVAVSGRPAWEVGATVALTALVVARHRENIGRLLRREEQPLQTPGAGR
jgi:glycerol-3-phosphate acyltransferase PlsY